MSDYYHEYLVDCALIIGANEFSELLPPENITYSDANFMSGKYQQQIIGAVSSTVALFPFTPTKYNYPAEQFQRYSDIIDEKQTETSTQNVSKNDLQTIRDLLSHYNKNDGFTSIGQSTANRRSSRDRNRRRSIKKTSLDEMDGSCGSVSKETIKSFPATYFNNNLELSSIYVGPQIQFLPITNNVGTRSFVIRLKFFRKFIITKNVESGSDKLNKIKLEIANDDIVDLNRFVFVPSNIVFFTKYPYFDLFREILSQFYDRIDGADTGIIEQQLMNYSSILTRIPVMKSERLKITFSINGDRFSIGNSYHIFNEVINWDMTILFQTLSIDDIVIILMAMFQEQKIVFLANDTNLITLVTETIFLLFRPFKWKHFYLTTTPVHLYELVDAIFPFILGLPHELKNKIIKHYPDLIIVDLEEGNISLPKSCKLQLVSSNLIDQLKQAIQRRDWLNSFNTISSLNPLSLDHLKQQLSESYTVFSSKILTLFMMFMVDIFQEIIPNISSEKKGTDLLVITLDKFLNSSKSENVPFFKAIYRTDNFNCFIDDILRKMVDNDWSQMCARRYPDLLEESKSGTVIKFGRTRNDSNRKSDYTDHQSFILKEFEQQEIEFPTLSTDGGNFYKDLLANINSLKNTPDVMKLRAEVLLRFGNTLRSLEEFHAVLQILPSEINNSKLRKIIHGLNSSALIKLKKLPFHLSLFEKISFDLRRNSEANNLERHCVEQFYPPTVPIPKNNFIHECRRADIAEYESAINAMFVCLTLESKSSRNKTKCVHPEIFQCFYNNWINSTLDVSDVELNSEYYDEIIIKCTDTCVRVDGYGQGRVVLTQYRLCFIRFGQSSDETIANFANENSIGVKMERKFRGFGKVVEIIEVTVHGREQKTILWITKETHVWMQLILEIRDVHRLAYNEKDKNLIGVMTEQCIIYENMVTCSQKNAFFKTHLVEMAKKMLPCSHEQKTNSKKKVDEHRQYLIERLMPSPKQLVTIHCTVEVYKPHLQNFDLWCACVSGGEFFIKIIQVIDRRLHKLLEEKIEVPMRIQAMAHAPNTNKVVVCCMSHIALIVDTNSHAIDRRLSLSINTNSYPICCMSFKYDPHFVYFGTNNGEIFSWNIHADTTEIVSKLADEDHISSIHPYSFGSIIIVSLYRFILMSTNGTILNLVVISDVVNDKTKVNCVAILDKNTKLLAGLARLPVLLEYDISNPSEVTCLRKINMYTNKDFSFSAISNQYELSSAFVGISSILVVDNSETEKRLWIMFKDGTIEIRDYATMAKITKFNAHVDAISTGMLCTVKKQDIVVSVGREDGKVNLWNLHPS